MAVPNPDLCTSEEWDAYLTSVDVASLPWGDVNDHRERVERYTARLLREQATAREETTRLLDARDRTSAEAEALSARCRGLHQEVLNAGAAVIAVLRALPEDSVAIADAREREVVKVEALAVARAELATANLRAIQAILDAR
jgi:hypothetical protein